MMAAKILHMSRQPSCCLSWHVQNFVAICSSQNESQLNSVPNGFEFRMKKVFGNQPIFPGCSTWWGWLETNKKLSCLFPCGYQKHDLAGGQRAHLTMIMIVQLKFRSDENISFLFSHWLSYRYIFVSHIPLHYDYNNIWYILHWSFCEQWIEAECYLCQNFNYESHFFC